MNFIDCVSNIEGITKEQVDTISAEFEARGGANVLNSVHKNEMLKSVEMLNNEKQKMSVQHADFEKKAIELLDVLHNSKQPLAEILDMLQYQTRQGVAGKGNASVDTRQSSFKAEQKANFRKSLHEWITNNPEFTKNYKGFKNGIENSAHVTSILNNSTGPFRSRTYDKDFAEGLSAEMRRLSYDKPKPPPKGTEPAITDLAQVFTDFHTITNNSLAPFGMNKIFLQGRSGTQGLTVGALMKYAPTRRASMKAVGKKLSDIKQHRMDVAIENYVNENIHKVDVERMQQASGIGLKEGELRDIMIESAKNGFAGESLSYIPQGKFHYSNKQNHRVIHIKDEFAFEYAEKHGSGPMADVLKTIDMNSHQLPLLETFSAKPHAMLELLLENVGETNMTKAKTGKTITDIKNIFDVVTGENRVVNQSQALADWTDLANTVAISQFAADFVFSAGLLDPATLLVEFGFHGVRIRDAIHAKTELSRVGKKVNEKLNDDLYLSNDKDFGSATVRYHAGDDANQFKNVAAFKHFLARFSWLSQMTDSGNNFFVKTVAMNLAKNKKVAFKNLDKNLQGRLKHYGIENKEWQLAVKGVKQYGGKDGIEVLTPAGVKNLKYKDVKDVYGDKITRQESRELLDELYQKLNTHYNRSSKRAVIRETGQARVIIQKGFIGNRISEPGTPIGTMASFFGALLAHPTELGLSVIRGIWVNSLNWQQRTKILGQLFAYLYVGGYLVNVAKQADDVLTGEQDGFSGPFDNLGANIAVGGFFGLGEVFGSKFTESDYKSVYSFFGVAPRLLENLVETTGELVGVVGSEKAQKNGLGVDSLADTLGRAIPTGHFVIKGIRDQTLIAVRKMGTKEGKRKMKSRSDWLNQRVEKGKEPILEETVFDFLRLLLD